MREKHIRAFIEETLEAELEGALQRRRFDLRGTRAVTARPSRAPAVALPKAAEPWSLTSLREKLIRIGAKAVSHGRYASFQMAEVAVSRQMFAVILSLIARLRGSAAA